MTRAECSFKLEKQSRIRESHICRGCESVCAGETPSPHTSPFTEHMYTTQGMSCFPKISPACLCLLKLLSTCHKLNLFFFCDVLAFSFLPAVILFVCYVFCLSLSEPLFTFNSPKSLDHFSFVRSITKSPFSCL